MPVCSAIDESISPSPGVGQAVTTREPGSRLITSKITIELIEINDH